MASTFEYTQNLLAACPTFQYDILGDVTYHEAKDRVYEEEALSEADAESEDQNPGDGADEPAALEPRPYAIVIESTRADRRAGIGEWSGEGTVLVAIEVPVPDEYLFDVENNSSDETRQKFRWRRKWGTDLLKNLRADLREYAGKSHNMDPLLNVNDIEVIQFSADAEEMNPGEDYIGFVLALSWR